MIKTVVSIITILSILLTSPDEFRVFKSGQFCPFWDQFCSFAYIIRLGDRFCLRITFAVLQHCPFKIFILFQNFYIPPGFNGLQSKVEIIITGMAQNNTSVKPSSIASSASKGGIRNFITSCWFAILQFCPFVAVVLA